MSCECYLLAFTSFFPSVSACYLPPSTFPKSPCMVLLLLLLVQWRDVLATLCARFATTESIVLVARRNTISFPLMSIPVHLSIHPIQAFHLHLHSHPASVSASYITFTAGVYAVYVVSKASCTIPASRPCGSKAPKHSSRNPNDGLANTAWIIPIAF